MPSRELQSQSQHDQAPRDRERERHLVHENVTPFNNISAIEPFVNRRSLSNREVSRKLGEEQSLQKRFWREGQDNRKKAESTSALYWPNNETPSSFFSGVLAQTSSSSADFTHLPFDVLQRIAGAFSWPDLWAATCTCKLWSKALAPLREGMLLLHWGKMFKHGRGVARNWDKALESFRKGAAHGCAPAMVDAGLLLWELGKRDEGIKWYKQAAELKYPAAMCNLGLAYLQETSSSVEAVKWLEEAAVAGHVRAQYSFGLCLQQGRGVECNLPRAAWWYLRAAEGGSSRAMYNVALCFRTGEGITRNYNEAKRWMRRAAMAGHRKAQFEHGLTLFAEGDGGLALVFLELATRAGESGATHIRDALLMQLSPKLRCHALSCADNFQPGNKRNHR